MNAVFLTLVNMGVAAGVLIVVVMLLRPLLWSAPKWIRGVLWAFVAIRLLCPTLPQSPVSLIPSADTLPPEMLTSQAPAIHTGYNTVNSTVNPIIAEMLAPTSTDTLTPMERITSIAVIVWVCGMAVMLTYAVVSAWRVKRRVREAVPCGDGVWMCEEIATPFVLGVFRPRIYLPSFVNDDDAVHVIAHERAHLKRGDHLTKPVGFLLLTVYWWNPLVWVAYVLFCRDLELAADEHVIRSLGTDGKKPYAQTLVNCSVRRGTIAACPLAFGQVGVKARVKSVLSYKKPVFWLLLAAAVALIAAAVLFLTNPFDKRVPTSNAAAVCWFDETTAERNSQVMVEQLPDITFTVKRTDASQDTICYEKNGIEWELVESASIKNAYFYDVTGDGIPELCTTVSHGAEVAGEHIVVRDVVYGGEYIICDCMNTDYGLCVEEAQLCATSTPHNQNRVRIFSLTRGALSEAGLANCYNVYLDEDPMDRTVYDVDGDGVKEDCVLTDGGLSVIKAFYLSIGTDGKTEYVGIFSTRYWDIAFAQQDGELKVVLDVGRMSLYCDIVPTADGRVELLADGQPLSMKVMVEPTAVFERTATRYTDDDIRTIAAFDGSLQTLQKRYPIEWVNTVSDGYQVLYVGETTLADMLYDDKGVPIGAWVHNIGVEAMAFSAVKTGMSVSEVQGIDPDGEYLFLHTGSEEPRSSRHYTVDGYLVTVEYDEQLCVTNVRYGVI